MPENIEGSSAVYENARKAVEDLLGLKKFIREQQWDNIETRLLDAEARAADAEARAADAEVMSAGQSANVVFFAECLPYAAAIVHTGSTLGNFVEAKKWAGDQHVLRFTDAVSILAVLTFLYLVDTGITKSSEGKDLQKRQQWQDIKRRVDTLLGPEGTSPKKEAQKAPAA